MTQSPFAVINQVCTEPTPGWHDLLILAKDSPRLNKDERATLNRVAEEMEALARAFLCISSDLVIATQRYVAVIDARPKPQPFMACRLGASFRYALTYGVPQ